MAYIKDVTHTGDEASYWAGQTYDFDAVVTNAGATSIGCSRCTVKYKRTVPVGLSEDLMMFTFSIAKSAGSHIYNQLSSADLVTAETSIDVFVNAVKALQHSSITCVEYAWHGVSGTSPRTKDGRGQKMGPAVRTTVKSIPGALSVGRSPDQLAVNVTLRTASRKHWGRFAIPGLDIGKWDPAYGRVLTSSVDAISAAADSLYSQLQTAGFMLGVWSQLHPAFLAAKSTEVDDVPDIVRRRRAKRRNYAKINA